MASMTYGAEQPPAPQASSSLRSQDGAAMLEVEQQGENGMQDALVRQVEWYLGRENLSRDYFLMQQMREDFFVKLEILANFPKMKRMYAEVNAAYLAQAIRHRSSNLELDETETLVRPTFVLSEKRRSSIILRDVPAGTSAADIEALFATNQSLPVPESIRPDVGDTWFVTYDSYEKARNGLDSIKNLSIHGAPVKARLKTETIVRSLAQASGPGMPQQQLQPPLVAGGMMGMMPGMPGSHTMGAHQGVPMPQQQMPMSFMGPPPMGAGPPPMGFPIGYGFPPPPAGFRGPPGANPGAYRGAPSPNYYGMNPPPFGAHPNQPGGFDPAAMSGMMAAAPGMTGIPPHNPHQVVMTHGGGPGGGYVQHHSNSPGVGSGAATTAHRGGGRGGGGNSGGGKGGRGGITSVNQRQFATGAGGPLMAGGAQQGAHNPPGVVPQQGPNALAGVLPGAQQQLATPQQQQGQYRQPGQSSVGQDQLGASGAQATSSAEAVSNKDISGAGASQSSSIAPTSSAGIVVGAGSVSVTSSAMGSAPASSTPTAGPRNGQPNPYTGANGFQLSNLGAQANRGGGDGGYTKNEYGAWTSHGNARGGRYDKSGGNNSHNANNNGNASGGGSAGGSNSGGNTHSKKGKKGGAKKDASGEYSSERGGNSDGYGHGHGHRRKGETGGKGGIGNAPQVVPPQKQEVNILNQNFPPLAGKDGVSTVSAEAVTQQLADEKASKDKASWAEKSAAIPPTSPVPVSFISASDEPPKRQQSLEKKMSSAKSGSGEPASDKSKVLPAAASTSVTAASAEESSVKVAPRSAPLANDQTGQQPQPKLQTPSVGAGGTESPQPAGAGSASVGASPSTPGRKGDALSSAASVDDGQAVAQAAGNSGRSYAAILRAAKKPVVELSNGPLPGAAASTALSPASTGPPSLSVKNLGNSSNNLSVSIAESAGTKEGKAASGDAPKAAAASSSVNTVAEAGSNSPAANSGEAAPRAGGAGVGSPGEGSGGSVSKNGESVAAAAGGEATHSGRNGEQAKGATALAGSAATSSNPGSNNGAGSGSRPVSVWANKPKSVLEKPKPAQTGISGST
ncbi:La-related protein [Porphyridium purpureum]|uniref:La-related protein n=1 Tax=Porphyridium purpureum TaxID=35688 RepID=A0A5J4YQF7_PORPP|nr:La-related protein [Porphyridium purpureum]|eukprot:POR2960..scf236_6